MGIPKFFRWMSERYPLCSQVITENRIPEFDNLYLDMNGIIHNCSHSNDNDAHYRIPEEQIWMACFSYIDHLFTKIKPRKLFFMAIDGVAPRAKMNQQRSRRFRKAQEDEEARNKVLARGEELPSEDPFDSNCITPGTEFMKKLTAQLKYFINKKVTEDANWRDIEIVLSGHEVPGEGEHKIMEYIRLAKAQPEYDPNVRHCLYGLDADLIMLGLLSHDPHFCLLREEVTFGKSASKAKKSVDTQNFYLMHLSLLREYLNLEFQDLHTTLSFPYDLERIIDDFVLLALFIGNDFLPHLPNLHIGDGALTLMFSIYKRVLPTIGGYLHEGGILDLERLELIFKDLAEGFEKEVYESELSESRWLEGKRTQNWTEKQLDEKLDGLRIGSGGRKGAKGEVVITAQQKTLYEEIRKFVLTRRVPREENVEPTPQEEAVEPAPQEEAFEPAPQEEGAEPIPQEESAEPTLWPVQWNEGAEPIPQEEGAEPVSQEEGAESAPQDEGAEPAPREEDAEPIPWEVEPAVWETEPAVWEEGAEPAAQEEGTEPAPQEEEGAESIPREERVELIPQEEESVQYAPRLLHFPSELPARDRRFIQTVAKDLGLRYMVEYSAANDSKHIYLEIAEDEDEDTSEDEEAVEARERVLKKWDNAQIVQDVITEEEREEREKRRIEEGVKEWKRVYYWEKMNIVNTDPAQLDPLINAYITGLQWVLHYYYSGVASWGWFYPYHYAPKILDLVDLKRFAPIEFELGKPFKPFEQLMGVLPSLSKKLIPPAYRELMTDPLSPIIDFYPLKFDLDMNGKKQDWEAVIKIPFIDEVRLLEAMRSREHRLTTEERERTKFGESLKFSYDETIDAAPEGGLPEDRIYVSPIPGTFPDIYHCKTKMELFHLPTLEGGSLRLNKGLCEGVNLGIRSMAGFPSLQTIPHTAALEFHGINVFQTDSKNESIVLTLQNQYDNQKPEDLAKELLGKRTFVGYPFLQEALVVAMSDDLFRYELAGVQGENSGQLQVVKSPHEPYDMDRWRKMADRIETMNSKKRAVRTGHVECVVHVLLLKGLKRLDNGALIKEYAEQGEEMEHAVQTIVKNVVFEDSRFEERPPLPLPVEFPLHTQVFFLGSLHYGAPAEVIEHSITGLTIKMIVNSVDSAEPEFGRTLADESDHALRYFPSFFVAKSLQISSLTLSKLTASLFVVSRKEQRLNLGLNLKFEAKRQKVLGYSRKNMEGLWEYSDKAMSLLTEYKTKFPEFVAGLERKMKSDFYQAEDFYPAESAYAKVQEINTWLKSIGIHDLERTALNAEQLPKEYVTRIQQAADQLRNSGQRYRQVVIKSVPRHALLKPAHAPTRLLDQDFQLGDRVIFVQDSGIVPIAAKGTVIGMEGKSIDVVFDDTFMGGTSLGGRCSPYRGMTVNSYSILNLSNKRFLGSSSGQARNGQTSKPVLTHQFRHGQPQHRSQHQHHQHHQIGMNGPVVIAQRPASASSQTQAANANGNPVTRPPPVPRGGFRPRPPPGGVTPQHVVGGQQFRPRGRAQFVPRGPTDGGRGFRGGRGGRGVPHVPAVPM